MKILQVCHTFKPLWESGGIARSVYELSKSLVENGHDVCVYTTNRSRNRELKDYGYDYELNEPVDIDGIEVYYFQDISKFLPRSFPPLPLPYYLPLVARKELKKFDVVHIHGNRTFIELSASYYARKYGIPYILHARGSVLPSFQKENENLRKIYDFLFGTKILKNASKVIAITSTEKDHYTQMGLNKEKIEIIPNGINFSEYETLPAKGYFRKKYNLTDEKIVLSLGRLVKLKGIDLLIDTFNDLSHILENIKLVIVGPDGGFLKELKNQVKNLEIEDKVIFTGPLFETEKIQAYVDSDVYVLPSSYEIFGNTVLEASACGIPIVVTDRSGVGNLIKKLNIDKELGFVVEYDQNQLKNAILSSVTTESQESLAERRRKIIKTEFDQKNIIKRFELLYAQLIMEKSNEKE